MEQLADRSGWSKRCDRASILTSCMGAEATRIKLKHKYSQQKICQTGYIGGPVSEPLKEPKASTGQANPQITRLIVQ